ncbi:MAG TPA: hypothetical protein VMG34_03770 [Bacteroidota bacterium]|nr:hypothetical protein [Bacteroidota bacterium]
MSPSRRDDEPPPAVSKDGWRYHHTGIPTHDRREGERYLPQFKLYVSGFETSRFGIEWMRFEPDSPVPEIIKSIPHVAFEVDDLQAAISGRTILGGIDAPSPGVRTAMIVENGAPIELIEFSEHRSISKT